MVDLNADGTIDSADGRWAGKLNSDWFGTVFGTRDIRFSNKVDSNVNWDGSANSGIFGQTSNDPGRRFVVPKPGSLALVSLALLGLGALRRKRTE